MFGLKCRNYLTPVSMFSLHSSRDSLNISQIVVCVCVCFFSHKILKCKIKSERVSEKKKQNREAENVKNGRKNEMRPIHLFGKKIHVNLA